MRSIRTLPAALAALCLALLFAGLLGLSTPASAHGAAPHSNEVAALVHATGAPSFVAGDGHGAELADSQPERVAAKSGHCTENDAKGGALCCGYACHAIFPAHQAVLGVAGVRTASVRTGQDDQVGDCRPSTLERPPRLA